MNMVPLLVPRHKMAFHWKIASEYKMQAEKSTTIRNRFIIQSNKVSKIAKVPGLEVVETLTSKKHADLLNTSFAESDRKLKVMVQVNTSKEEAKNGLEENEVNELAGKYLFTKQLFLWTRVDVMSLLYSSLYHKKMFSFGIHWPHDDW